MLKYTITVLVTCRKPNWTGLDRVYVGLGWDGCRSSQIQISISAFITSLRDLLSLLSGIYKGTPLRALSTKDRQFKFWKFRFCSKDTPMFSKNTLPKMSLLLVPPPSPTTLLPFFLVALSPLFSSGHRPCIHPATVPVTTNKKIVFLSRNLRHHCPSPTHHHLAPFYPSSVILILTS